VTSHNIFKFLPYCSIYHYFIYLYCLIIFKQWMLYTSILYLLTIFLDLLDSILSNLLCTFVCFLILLFFCLLCTEFCLYFELFYHPDLFWFAYYFSMFFNSMLHLKFFLCSVLMIKVLKALNFSTGTLLATYYGFL
jgi:hypothetical protein